MFARLTSTNDCLTTIYHTQAARVSVRKKADAMEATTKKFVELEWEHKSLRQKYVRGMLEKVTIASTKAVSPRPAFVPIRACRCAGQGVLGSGCVGTCEA